MYVSGVSEASRDLIDLARDVDKLGTALADGATDLAAKHAPVRSRISGNPVVSPARAVVTYAGVIYPAGFERAVIRELTPRAAHVVEDGIGNLITKRGLAS